MRYFSLINNSGETLDITSKTIFFTEVSGLGFEEETSFRHVGEVWWLNTASYRQTPITGRLIFTDYNKADPYIEFRKFFQFISKAPLDLVYYPNGLADKQYRKRVRVTKLEKSELNEYGVFDEAIEFTPYTPWYELVVYENSGGESDYKGRWIWGDGSEHPPVIFAPTPAGSTPPRFGTEERRWVALDVNASSDSPARFIMFGPIENPVWTHYVDGDVVSTGGFSSSISIGANEALVVDNVDEICQIKVYSCYTDGSGKSAIGEPLRDLYQKRNFNVPCFITLRAGRNRVAVTTSTDTPIGLRLEGYLYNAVV